MAISDFIRQTKNRIDTHGYRVVPSVCADVGKSIVSNTPYIGNIGINVFSKEWDVLVVLDACRLDVYRELINADTRSIWSVGSHSKEWIANTFNEVDNQDHIYI